MRREEKTKIKKGKKRIKIALLFLAVLLAIPALGFLVRIYREGDFSLFQGEKVIRPVPRNSPEQNLSEQLNKAEIRVISLSIIGEKEIEASVSGGTKIIFKTEEIGQQVSSLQLMLSRFKIEGRIPKKIDLRFEKPMVVF